MKIRKIDHVGIIVKDLAVAKAFFLDFGLVLEGEAEMEGEFVDKIVALKDVKDVFAFLRPPDGGTGVELIQYYTPTDETEHPLPLSNTLGIRHIAFLVEDIEAHVARLKAKGYEAFGEVYQYENSYKLVFIRGPEGIILELDEELT